MMCFNHDKTRRPSLPSLSSDTTSSIQSSRQQSNQRPRDSGRGFTDDTKKLIHPADGEVGKYLISSNKGETAAGIKPNVVHHHYHDYAQDTEEMFAKNFTVLIRKNDVLSSSYIEKERKMRSRMKRGPRGGVSDPFPLKLHRMLETAEEEGLDNVVSWQPHGRAFVVRKSNEFVRMVMPKYFRQTKITSFQRQLNLYGFSRLTRGKDMGGYYHELFLRGRPYLSQAMVRIKIKGTGHKAASNPETEPDFYTMPPVALECLTPSSISDQSSREERDEELSNRKINTSPSNERRTTDAKPDEVTSTDTPLTSAVFKNIPQVISTKKSAQSSRKQVQSEGVTSVVSSTDESTSHPPNDSLPNSDTDACSYGKNSEKIIVSFEGKSFYYLDPFDPLLPPNCNGSFNSINSATECLLRDDEDLDTEDDLSLGRCSSEYYDSIGAIDGNSASDDINFGVLLDKFVDAEKAFF